ncbi:MAG: hypothetical protein GX994_05115 [Firmicutes bacterium]|nr:hypothetical protein [Bacillota bacterium]
MIWEEKLFHFNLHFSVGQCFLKMLFSLGAECAKIINTEELRKSDGIVHGKAWRGIGFPEIPNGRWLALF